MDYQALYRRYRPQRFDEVVGQTHVTDTLAREVTEGRVAHAYLFAGPRGTGKTTTARLLAKALNCADRSADGEPCNVCPSCVGITEGTSLDVIELDAASHNSVEDVREIRVNVGTVAATAGAHRVYILDEAHMLSRAASNALLKTLEEPPGHVVFVLATTDPYKLPDTIRSRSQRFDFLPVPSETLVERLAGISARESFDVDGAALAMVATHAAGSVRDAESLLEQVAALGGGVVRTDVITRALGLADRESFGRLAAAIVAGDAPAALTLVAELASRGADLRRFVAEAVEYFRGIFLTQFSPNVEQVVDEPAETIEEWRRQAGIVPKADVLRTVDALAEVLLELRQGREERLVIELALLRLTRPETDPDTSALLARVDRLEARLRSLEARPAAPISAAEPEPTRRPQAAPTAAEGDSDAPFAPAGDTEDLAPVIDIDRSPHPEAPPATDLDLASFEAIWPALVSRVRDASGPVRHALVREAVPVSVVGGVVSLEIPAHKPFHFAKLSEDGELKATMARLAADLLGSAPTIEFVLGGEGPSGGADVHGGTTEPARVPDKDSLMVSDEDPEDLVKDLLGGEIQDE